MTFILTDQLRQGAIGYRPRHILRIEPVLVALLLAVSLPGCDSAGKPASVRGTVKFKGELVAKGSVRVSTEDGTPGPGGIGRIEDGHYEIDSCKGLRAGKYLVIIHGFKETGKMIQIDDANPPRKEELQFIPRRYNDDSKQTIELSPGDNEKDFDLTP
jgi:hypothetical protein